MQAFFNSFSNAPPTEADTLVDRATNQLLIGPDWAANMEVSDMGLRPDCCEEVVRAIRRRMLYRNPKVAVLALTVLETCMKNCDTDFHDRVATKEFQADMVRLAKGTGEVAEKALMLIESWADAFQVDGHPQFRETYNSLRGQGITFPRQELGTAAPIATPPPKGGEGSAASPPPRGAAEGAPSAGTSGAGERERPVFVQTLPEVDGAQTEDKARTNRWTLGFLPGYSSIPSDEKDADDDDEEDEDDVAGAAGSTPAEGRNRATSWDATGRPSADPRLPVARSSVVDRTDASVPPDPLPFDPSDSVERHRESLALARNNAQLARDCLSVITPAQGGELATNDVLQEVLTLLRASEPRLVNIIESGVIDDEALLQQFIEVHETVTSAFDLYDQKLAESIAADDAAAPASAERPAIADLLDLDAPEVASPAPPSSAAQPPSDADALSDLLSSGIVMGAESSANEPLQNGTPGLPPWAATAAAGGANPQPSTDVASAGAGGASHLGSGVQQTPSEQSHFASPPAQLPPSTPAPDPARANQAQPGARSGYGAAGGPQYRSSNPAALGDFNPFAPNPPETADASAPASR